MACCPCANNNIEDDGTDRPHYFRAPFSTIARKSTEPSDGPTSEASEWALLCPSERPDLQLSLKLGLDPSAPIITRVYSFEEVLGRGAFGEVVRGRHVDSQREYAIKKLATSTLRSGDLRNEITILKECRHPNIISLVGCYATEEYVYLVMELADGGALFDVVTSSGHLSEAFAAAATMQVASALQYMHAKGVVHRDMKPENVLLADRRTKLIKLCDFGLSKIFSSVGSGGGGDDDCSARDDSLDDRSQRMVMKSKVGSHWYAPPELIDGSASYDESIDMWGLGLLVYILVSGKHPFDCDDMYGAVTSGRLYFDEPAWRDLSPSCKELVAALLRPLPKERVTADAVLRHAWLTTDGLKNDATLQSSLAYLHEFRALEIRHAAFKVLSHSLTDEDVAEVRAIYELLDIDHKGYLSHDDLNAALNHKARATLGMDAPMPRNIGRFNLSTLLRTLLNRSLRKTSIVTFAMFLEAVLEADDELVSKNLLKVFETLDHERRGVVAVSAVEQVLRTFGLEAAGMAEASRMLSAAANGEKELSYDAFVQVLLRESRQSQVASRVTDADRWTEEQSATTAARPSSSLAQLSASLRARLRLSRAKRPAPNRLAMSGPTAGAPPAAAAAASSPSPATRPGGMPISVVSIAARLTKSAPARTSTQPPPRPAPISFAGRSGVAQPSSIAIEPPALEEPFREHSDVSVSLASASTSGSPVSNQPWRWSNMRRTTSVDASCSPAAPAPAGHWPTAAKGAESEPLPALARLVVPESVAAIHEAESSPDEVSLAVRGTASKL